MATVIRFATAAEKPIDLDQAAALIRKQTGGRIVGAETTTVDGQTVHRIKVLMPDGRVKIVLVNAATGAVLP